MERSWASFSRVHQVVARHQGIGEDHHRADRTGNSTVLNQVCSPNDGRKKIPGSKLRGDRVCLCHYWRINRL